MASIASYGRCLPQFANFHAIQAGIMLNIYMEEENPITGAGEER